MIVKERSMGLKLGGVGMMAVGAGFTATNIASLIVGTGSRSDATVFIGIGVALLVGGIGMLAISPSRAA
jgi:hypothetical protein